MLFNKLDLAEKLWTRTDYALEVALVASGIMKHLSAKPWKLNLGPEEIASMEAGQVQFEEIAVGLIGQCYKEDPEDCEELLRSPMVRFEPHIGALVITIYAITIYAITI